MEPIRSTSVCPDNSFAYNSTLCACNPGYYKSEGGGGGGSCVLLEAKNEDWVTARTVAPGGGPMGPSTFLGAVLPMESLERMVRSEKALLKATLVAVALWLAFCVAVRSGRLDGGKSVWFRVRWRIARLDVRFATKHQLDDNNVVKKRKTELGGAFSIASWIWFVGLSAVLVYRLITRRTMEVPRLRSSNAPDLLSFINDLEFNITTISTMTCSHLHAPTAAAVTGNPGLMEHSVSVSPMSSYANYSCHNSSRGPTLSLSCSRCQVSGVDHYISWFFGDLPNDPASAAGFEFRLLAKSHDEKEYMNSVSGTLDAGSYVHGVPVTLRGLDLNILKVHLFPQRFDYLKNLRLIQPVVHDFVPGSSFSEPSKLQKSLEGSEEGLVKVTLYIRYMSGYIVEVDRENILGIVEFLADVGGIHAISVAIFVYFMLQCESRVKKLHSEDTTMREIKSHIRAQKNWNKLRTYVRYTWGCSTSNLGSTSRKHVGNSVLDYLSRLGSLHKRKQMTVASSRGSSNKVSSIPHQMHSEQNTVVMRHSEKPVKDQRRTIENVIASDI